MASPDPISMVFSALAKSTETPLRYSDETQKQIDDTIKGLGALRTKNDANLLDYETGLKKARGQIEGLSNEDIGTLTGQIGNYAKFDPFGSYKQTGDYLTGLFDKAAGGIADIGRSRVNLANANVYGGRGGGSYGENLLLNNVSRNLAPVFGQVIGNITPAFQAQQGARQMNLSALTGLIAERAGIPLRVAELALEPVKARLETMLGELGATQGAATAAKTNYRGSKVEKNWAGKMLDQANSSFDTVLNAAVSLAGDAVSAYTGGMAGGGGGGNVAVPAPNGASFTPSKDLYQTPNWISNPPTMWSPPAAPAPVAPAAPAAPWYGGPSSPGLNSWYTNPPYAQPSIWGN